MTDPAAAQASHFSLPLSEEGLIAVGRNGVFQPAHLEVWPQGSGSAQLCLWSRRRGDPPPISLRDEGDGDALRKLLWFAVRHLCLGEADELARTLQREADDALPLVERDLDELTHDAASKLASEANNGGLPAQLHFLLLLGWSPEEIRRQLGMPEPEER